MYGRCRVGHHSAALPHSDWPGFRPRKIIRASHRAAGSAIGTRPSGCAPGNFRVGKIAAGLADGAITGINPAAFRQFGFWRAASPGVGERNSC